MYKNIKHIVYFSICDIFVSEILCRVCHICIWILNNSNWLFGHLNGSVNCDFTGPLWCHQKAVSCLGWDKSISDTRGLSCTPRCMRQDDLMTVLSPQWDFLYWQDDIFILNQGPVMQKGLPCHVHSNLVWKKQIKMHNFHVTVISMTSQENTELVPGVWLNSLKIATYFDINYSNLNPYRKSQYYIYFKGDYKGIWQNKALYENKVHKTLFEIWK